MPIYLGSTAINLDGFSKVYLGTNQIWAALVFDDKYVRITTTGSTFAPVIELVSGSTATVNWIVEGGSTYTGINPNINFGSTATRHIYMSVFNGDNNALADVITFNIGFLNTEDAGRYSLSATYNHTTRESVSKIENVRAMTGLVRFLSSIPTLACALDFTGMSALEHIECYCAPITAVNLTGCTSLKRVNFEGCNLSVLDLNPVAGNLYDLRASQSNTPFTLTPLTAPLAHLYHYCSCGVTNNQPTAEQLPVIEELLNWSGDETGALVIRSTSALSIQVNGNHYTSLDLLNQFPTGHLGIVNASNNEISSVVITGCDGIRFLDLHNNQLNTTSVDAILDLVESWGTSGDEDSLLNLSGNATPTSAGYDNAQLLRSRGWTVTLDASIAVTGVNIDDTLSLNVGSTHQLTATISPANAVNKSVTWSSSNTNVATVNSSGLVTGISAGSVTITVTTSDGGYTDSCATTITAVIVAVTGVSIASTLSVNVGDTSQLTATISPSNASNTAVTWSSSNTGIATISTTGLVTAIAEGNATITVTTVDGSYTDICALTVSAVLEPGATLWSDNFDRADATGVTAVGNGWHTIQGTDANIVSGDIVLIGGGYGILGNTAGGNLPADYRVSMSLPATAKGGWFGLFGRWYNGHGVRAIIESDTSLTVGDAAGYNANDITLSTQNWPVSWSNDAITHTFAMEMEGSTITIIADEQVVCTGICEINSTITGTEIGFCGEGNNRVRHLIEATTLAGTETVAVSGVTISETLSINVGATSQLSAMVVPTNATNKVVSWSSSNTAYATVSSSGLVTAVAEGSATITVTTIDGSFTDTCIVTIAAAPTTTTITDSFDRTNSLTTLGNTDTGQAWTTQKGVFGIISNTAYLVTNANDNIATVESGLSDCTVEVTISTLAANTGLCLRFKDVNNYLKFGMVSGGEWYLTKVVSGVATDRGYFEQAFANGDVVKVVLNGSSIKAYVNGVEKLARTETNFQTETKHGLYVAESTAGRFNNFKVEAL